MNKFIEVTLRTNEYRKINISHIIYFYQPNNNNSVIVLSNGEKINTSFSYAVIEMLITDAQAE